MSVIRRGVVVALMTAALVLLPAAGDGGPARATDEPADTKDVPSPRGALLRSAAYPGWGQLANGKPFKACVIMAVEAYLAGVALSAARSASDAGELAAAAVTPEEIARFEERRVRYENRRNGYLWWLGAAVLYSMLDAYVDANLTGVGQDASKPPPVLVEPVPGSDGGLMIGVSVKF